MQSSPLLLEDQKILEELLLNESLAVNFMVVKIKDSLYMSLLRLNFITIHENFHVIRYNTDFIEYVLPKLILLGHNC